MTTPRHKPGQAGWAELHARYREKLGHLALDLDRFRDQKGYRDETWRAEIGRLAHRLHGSGRTFGFGAVTDAAANLERAIGENCGYEELALATAHLADACRKAVETEPLPWNGEPGAFLFIGHNPNLIELLSKSSGADFPILAAQDFDAALDILERETVSVVIADMAENLPLARLPELVQAANVAQFIVIAQNRRQAAVARAIGGTSVKIVMTANDFELAAQISNALKPDHRLVLIADDDDIVRELLHRRFAAHGFEVDVAGNGEEALARMTLRIPDIIVLDRAMPLMNGIELLKIIKRDTRLFKVPVLMLTSQTAQEKITQAREAGVSAYMIKPFSPDSVVQRCQQILDRPKPSEP